MAAGFLWRGGSALDAAADWTDLAAGTGPSAVPPGTADAATIDTPATDVTGTLRAAALTVEDGATLSVASGGAAGLFAPVSGAGTLAIGADATLFPAGGVAAGVAIDFAGAHATLDLTGPVAATLGGFVAGDAIDCVTQTIIGAVWSAGTLTLTIAGSTTEALALPGSFAGPFLVAPDAYGGSVVTLTTPAPLPAEAATLTLDGVYGGAGSAESVTASGSVALAGSLHAGSLAASGQFAVLPGGTLIAGTVQLAGVIDVQGAAVVGMAATAAGTLAIGSGATLAGSGRIDAALACAGVLAAGPGVLGVFGAATGSGTLAIGAGATLSLADAVGAGLTVAFGGPATLQLAAPAAFAGTLEGVQAGDTIDLCFAPSPAGLAVAAQFAGHRILTAPDGTGGTLVTIPCYAAGTRIATPAGAAAVETLRPGDVVLAWRDGAWRPAPIRWVGRIEVDLRHHPAPARAAPVRIAAHAFAAQVPQRDLLLSPEHAVFADGALIQAQALLNGATVVQAAVPRVTYCHIELDRHALLLAEGLPAESYLDTGNRAAFAGAAAPGDPAAAAAVWDAQACAPLLLGGGRVAAVQARLLARAAALGWEMTADAALRVRRQGRTVRLRSRAFVPAWLGLGPDRRRLGVAVAALHLDGRTLPPAAFGAGWHAPEAGWRWTDGDALLHLPRPGRLTLRRAAVAGQYWRRSDMSADRDCFRLADPVYFRDWSGSG
jgi:collagen type I/II/III/V/XI/XXIV/XXVII alpha